MIATGGTHHPLRRQSRASTTVETAQTSLTSGRLPSGSALRFVLNHPCSMCPALQWKIGSLTECSRWCATKPNGQHTVRVAAAPARRLKAAAAGAERFAPPRGGRESAAGHRAGRPPSLNRRPASSAGGCRRRRQLGCPQRVGPRVPSRRLPLSTARDVNRFGCCSRGASHRGPHNGKMFWPRVCLLTGCRVILIPRLFRPPGDREIPAASPRGS